ncbi:hypothetical protein Q4I28_007017, partial [Leishmania naiffi]
MALITAPTAMEGRILRCIGAPILALLGPPRAPLMSVCLFGRRALEHEGRVDKPAKAAVSDAGPASPAAALRVATRHDSSYAGRPHPHTGGTGTPRLRGNRQPAPRHHLPALWVPAAAGDGQRQHGAQMVRCAPPNHPPRRRRGPNAAPPGGRARGPLRAGMRCQSAAGTACHT